MSAVRGGGSVIATAVPGRGCRAGGRVRPARRRCPRRSRCPARRAAAPRWRAPAARLCALRVTPSSAMLAGQGRGRRCSWRRRRPCPAAGAVERGQRVGDGAMLDAGVARAAARGRRPSPRPPPPRRPPGELLERDVPEPGGVAPVGLARVDHQQPRGARVEQRERLGPARRVLGQQQPQLVPAVLDGARSGRRRCRARRRAAAAARVDAQHRRGGQGEGGVAEVEPARQPSIDRDRGAVAAVTARPSGDLPCGSGRASPHGSATVAGSTSSASPQRGQAGVSPGQPAPAATQTVRAAGGGGPDDHRVIGVGDDQRARVADQRARTGPRATPRTSLPRSSWSRLRLSSTIDLRVDRLGHRRDVQLVDLEHRVRRASRSAASAATAPSGMLAPVALCATGPPVRSAAASRWLVVVLPLVPETSADAPPRGEPAQGLRGPAASVTRPPMIDPSPMPSRRDNLPAQDPVHTATRPRPDPAATANLWRRLISGTVQRLLTRPLVARRWRRAISKITGNGNHVLEVRVWVVSTNPGRVNLLRLQYIRRARGAETRDRRSAPFCVQFALTVANLTGIGMGAEVVCRRSHRGACRTSAFLSWWARRVGPGDNLVGVVITVANRAAFSPGRSGRFGDRRLVGFEPSVCNGAACGGR